ncbi:hypothetical protein FAN16_24570 [Klebsiella pneumoniae subsp. pneumoniae]|nr:hypothetical protein FAN16_24570 [Klebsiella pneumoniae subsp. pneumoniae]SSL62967.1 Uncharacterised protein [Klebsiella pneumoniae]
MKYLLNVVFYIIDLQTPIITTDKSEIDRSGWSNNEKEVISGHYWWSLEELRQTNEIIFPLDLIINILEDFPCT